MTRNDTIRDSAMSFPRGRENDVAIFGYEFITTRAIIPVNPIHSMCLLV